MWRNRPPALAVLPRRGTLSRTSRDARLKAEQLAPNHQSITWAEAEPFDQSTGRKSESDAQPSDETGCEFLGSQFVGQRESDA